MNDHTVPDPAQSSKADKAAVSATPVAEHLLSSFGRLPPRAQLGLLASGAVALALVVWFLARVNTTTEQATAAVSKPRLMDLDPVDREAYALAKARRDRASVTAGSAQSALKSLQELIKQWSAVEALKTNDNGKLLASNPQAVEVIDAMFKKSRISAEEADTYERSLKALIEPLEVARNDPLSIYSPSDVLLKELEQQRDLLREALLAMQEQMDSIDAMLVTARRQNQPAPYSLAEALERSQEKTAHERADYLAGRERQRKLEADKAMADADDAYFRRITEEKNKARDSEAHSDALKIRASRDDIRAKYRPFLELGKFKPVVGKEPTRTDTAQPMSYTDLKAFGVFNDFKTFAKAGSGMWANTIRHENDRPKWQPFPTHEPDFDKYKQLFSEFCDLAPIWAKDGTLAP